MAYKHAKRGKSMAKTPKKKTSTPAPAQEDFLSSVEKVKKVKVPFSPTMGLRTKEDVQRARKKIPFPWAMKAAGKKLLHKTDAGGVKLNVQDESEAEKVFAHMKKIRHCEYVVVQPMRKGIELIVGGKIDPQFGPIVLVGSGGIYTEVLKDVSMRICPIEKKDAEEMVRELKIYPILKGTRGQKSVKLADLTQILLGINKLMQSGKVKELDLNPVIATPKSVEGVDVRIISS